MKIYIVDTNLLSKDVLVRSQGRSDLIILEEIFQERTQKDPVLERSIRESSIRIISLETHHYNKMKEILRDYGDQQNLLSLLLNEGSADVAILSFIIAERELASNALPEIREEFIIVTNDNGLIEVAEAYSIKVQTSL